MLTQGKVFLPAINAILSLKKQCEMNHTRIYTDTVEQNSKKKKKKKAKNTSSEFHCRNNEYLGRHEYGFVLNKCWGKKLT